MLEVVAAMIWDGERILLGRRPANKARPLLWELPGGKIEPGETPEQALIRECCEELNTVIEVRGKFCEVTCEYPDVTVHLSVYHARVRRGIPYPCEHAELLWAVPDETLSMDMCPADRDVMMKYVTGC